MTTASARNLGNPTTTVLILYWFGQEEMFSHHISSSLLILVHSLLPPPPPPLFIVFSSRSYAQSVLASYHENSHLYHVNGQTDSASTNFPPRLSCLFMFDCYARLQFVSQWLGNHPAEINATTSVGSIVHCKC